MKQKRTTTPIKTFGWKALALMLAFSGFYSMGRAQETLEIEPLEKLLKEQSSQKTTHSLKDLCYALVPSVYLRQETRQVKGDESPVRVITDASSFGQLYNESADFESVELIFVQVNNPEDLKESLDLSALEHFPNLKYIYFSCTFEICTGEDIQCERQVISDMLKGIENSDLTIVFTAALSQ